MVCQRQESSRQQIKAKALHAPRIRAPTEPIPRPQLPTHASLMLTYPPTHRPARRCPERPPGDPVEVDGASEDMAGVEGRMREAAGRGMQLIGRRGRNEVWSDIKLADLQRTSLRCI